MASSRVMLFGFVAAGGLLLLATSRKASAATPATPREPEPPQLPPSTPGYRAPTTEEGQALPFDRDDHPTASRYTDDLEPPAPSVGPVPTAPPEPSLPAPVAPPSVPSSPEAPIVLQPVVVTAEPRPATPAPAPSKLPSKRPFGDKPLDVEAGPANYGATPATPAATPTAPKVRSPKAAAQELLTYVTPILKQKRGSELGTKNAPNSFVKAAQIDMGIAADGIYGPATRAKAKQLGINLPARV